MSKRLIVLATAVVALATTVPVSAAPDSGQIGAAGLGATSPADSQSAVYIVELKGEPAATYTGELKGLPATSPLVTGATQLDSDAAATVAYVQFLRSGQRTFVRQLANALDRPVDVMHDYAFVLNGVAVELSAAEADVAARMPQVSAIEQSRTLQLDTDAGPKWIGAPGIWDGSAVPDGTATMGEGTIVGVIDTGINTDHPSFAAVGGDGYVHENPFGEGNYKGWCDPEHPNYDPVVYACNSKLVGMWSFESSGNDAEDDDGHGSHTAGTAAGNFITASLVAPTIVVTMPLQGVAPHANIISYDVCMAGGGCALAAIADAIDQAVDDGVHVTNYSIGGGGDNDEPWSESHVFETAWRRLRAAGIWAATSAGNAGPGAATTQKVAPWYTGVGASTHNRSVVNRLINMTGGETPPADMEGKSLSGGYGPATIVYALGRLHEDGTPDDGQCNTPFPPGTFTMVEIVACDRGIIARVDKGANVLAGGAGGLVLMNAAANGNSLNGDAHFLPAVHISYADGMVLKDWLDGGTGHIATISGTEFNLDPGNGDIMASFSSRGYSLINTCCIRDYDTADVLGQRWVNLLKPDVTAPGVDIWAPDNTDQMDPSPVAEYQLLSGTSMSGPHVAGSFALLRSLRPEWTPAQGQSALMLTSITEGVRKEDGVTPADPFDIGAGRINVSNAANAGFVVDETTDAMVAENPSTGGEPSTLNLASMADFRCIGTCSWTRTITSSWDEPVDWMVTTLPGDSGLALDVTPTSFTLAPGGEQEITVVADVTNVMTDTYAFGSVMFDHTGAGPADAHMPVAVRAPAYALPHTVVLETPLVYAIAQGTAGGTWAIDGIRSRPLGELSAEPMGLVIPEFNEVAVGQDTDNNPYNAITGTATILIDVPEGAVRVTAELRGGPAPAANLYVGQDLNGDGLVQQTEARCANGLGQSRAFCNLANPAPGPWWIMVHNVTASAPDAVDTIAVYHGAVAPGEGNLTATIPESVDGSAPWAMDLEWDLPAAAPGDVFYGAVAVRMGEETLFTMFLDVNGVATPPSVFLPDLSNQHIR